MSMKTYGRKQREMESKDYHVLNITKTDDYWQSHMGQSCILY